MFSVIIKMARVCLCNFTTLQDAHDNHVILVFKKKIPYDVFEILIMLHVLIYLRYFLHKLVNPARIRLKFPFSVQCAYQHG